MLRNEVSHTWAATCDTIASFPDCLPNPADKPGNNEIGQWKLAID